MAGQPVPAAEEESASGTAPLPQEGPSRRLVVEAGRGVVSEQQAVVAAFAYTACLFPYRVDRNTVILF